MPKGEAPSYDELGLMLMQSQVIIQGFIEPSLINNPITQLKNAAMHHKLRDQMADLPPDLINRWAKATGVEFRAGTSDEETEGFIADINKLTERIREAQKEDSDESNS